MSEFNRIGLILILSPKGEVDRQSVAKLKGEDYWDEMKAKVDILNALEGGWHCCMFNRLDTPGIISICLRSTPDQILIEADCVYPSVE